MKKKKNKRIQRDHQGFSLLEFVVVMVIFAIMSSVSIFNYNAYRNRIEYTNLAQDIALTIRQAQVYGLSGSDRRVGSSSINPNILFGSIIVDITEDRSVRGVAINPSTKTLILFEDANRNRIFDSSEQIIDQRTVINNSVNMSICFSSVSIIGNACEEELTFNDNFYITFTRPYPEPSIRYNGTNYSQVAIILKDSSGQPRMKIEVTPSGQIVTKKI